MRALSFLLVTLSLAVNALGADYFVYAGTYTRPGGSRGIYAYRFNPSSGKLSSLGVAAETMSPSFLIDDPKHQFVYAVNEQGATGNVSSFRIDKKSGKLTPLNSVSSMGNSPCHLALDHTGHWLAVANYGNGTMALYPIGADGKIGEAATVQKHEGSSANPDRQKGPHAHDVVFSPDNRFLLLADLGLDKIFVYRFDAAKGTLTPNDPPSGSVAPGAGVRHLAFHPNGRVVYAISEIGSTVTAFQYDPAKGTLNSFQSISTLPESFKGQSSTAEIAVNKAGTFVYGSNRGHDSIALFAVDPQKFTLTAMDHTATLGKTPRHFAFDPTGKFLIAANQDSNNILVFRVHPKSGQLTPTGQEIKDAAMPVSILFVPK